MYEQPVHFLQIVDDRQQNSFRLKCMQSVKRFVRDNDFYEIVKIKYQDDKVKMIREVDSIKLMKAMEIENLCYIDTDCFVNEPIYNQELKKGVPYFGVYSYNNTQMPDIYYFFVNGRPDYFRKNLNLDHINPKGYSVYIDSLKALQAFEYINEMSFIHCYSTLSEVVLLQQLRDIKLEYEEQSIVLKALKSGLDNLFLTVESLDKLRGR